MRATVRGALHRRHHLPNQDAIRVFGGASSPASLLIALADGHGSSKSFRSHLGARMAVAVASRVGQRVFAMDHPSQRKRWAENDLPRELVRVWQERVAQCLARHPLTETELSQLDAASRRQVLAHPLLIYGATLLLVVVAPQFILYVQLGDGDILTVNPEGGVERPFAKDSRLLGNETTSLCSVNAWQEVRVYLQILAGTPPALILAATDGYANAFRNEAGFHQVAADLWQMLQQGGVHAVKPHLQTWLNEASEQGSGDDISLGLIWSPKPLAQ